MYRILIALMALCWFTSPIVWAQLTAPNPSFELGEDAPDSWTPLTKTIGTRYLWDEETVNSGKRSLSIRATHYLYGRWKSDKLPVESGGYTWYTLTGQVKTERSIGEVYLAIVWLDANGHMITTSDSEMLPNGDNDWQTVTVSALPAQGATQLSLWCISNHNSGQVWFDDLALTLTSLPARGDISYEGFLNEHPTHPLAATAHRMRVKELYTKAKWTMEKGRYDADAQRRASALFAQAASIPRRDDVLTQSVPAAELATVQGAYEKLIDQAWWRAAQTAYSAQDFDVVSSHLTRIIQRNKNGNYTGGFGMKV